jgi:hypothetical protein
MGILDANRKKFEDYADKQYTKRELDLEHQSEKRRDEIEDNVKKGRISQSAAEFRLKKQDEKDQKELEKIRKKQESESKPFYDKTKEVIQKKVGNIIASGTKEVPVNQKNPGRWRKRASLEYRRANREYNSEARKMRSQVTPLSSFSAGLLGANAPPVRSKYPGTRETGMIDPLSNWSSGIMGASKVRQDPTMEGIASKMAGRQNPGRKPKKSNADPLVNLTKMLRGR